MNCSSGKCFLLLAATAMLPAQQPPSGASKHPFDAQSPSTIKYTMENGVEALEITNVAYKIVGSGIPGRPKNQRLVLRETIRTKEVVDEKGMDASTVIEAWPLGIGLKEKPLYSLTVPGIDPRTRNSDILQVSRGLEDVEWWSIYKLGSGEHLLDTYVPLLDFSVEEKRRYAGLEVPGDDAADARLTAPNVVAVVTYASPERVIREALITCNDAKRASLLRSYFDSRRAMTFTGRALRISISENYPSPPGTVTITVPIAADDLDVARSQLPAGIRVMPWKR